MNHVIKVAGLMILIIVSTHCGRQTSFPELKGTYFGQDLPGMTPEVFAPGIVSTKENEINAVFSPDGTTFYFSRDTYSNLSRAGRDYTIFYMERTDDGWQMPVKVPFAGEYMNGDMALSSDGSRLFYCSDRPLREGEDRKSDADIWVVDVTDTGWSSPRNLGSSVNSEANEWYPCTADDGTLYFSSSRDGGKGQSDLYRAEPVDGFYPKAQPLMGSINTQYREGDVFVAPDESYLIVTSSDRPDTMGKGDLYISFRNENDGWSEAIHLGSTINSTAHDYCPMLSPDGKVLFFSSKRRGQDDVFWVDADIIHSLKPEQND